MTTDTPLTPTEVISPVGTPAMPAPAPAAPTPPPSTPRAFRTWWLFKKWAWRNSAALAWALFIYSALRGLGTSIGFALPALPIPPQTPGGQRFLTIAVALWLFVICELQLTQFFTFALYTVALPVWLPFLALYHYFRNRLGVFAVKASSVHFPVLRIAAALILAGIYLWWPLPSRQVAFSLGLIALVPGFALFLHTFRFCVAPGAWMRTFRLGAHKLYETLKTAPASSAVNASAEATAQVEAIKRFLIARYECSFLGGIERGVLRKLVVSYFSALLLICLLYVGFVAALFLRAFSDSPEGLALALGRRALPNLIHMAFLCSLGALGEVRIDGSVLPPGGAAVVLLLNLARVATGIVLTATFFGGYSADIAKAEATREDPPKGSA